MNRLAFLALAASFACLDAAAFRLQAMGAAARPAVQTRQARGFLSLFGSDVHERINGDMQFLHAMAAKAGEKPADTREKAMRWLEFSYRVARGEIGPRVNVFSLREAGSEMDAATRDWASSLFRAPDKQLWRVQDVFLPGTCFEAAPQIDATHAVRERPAALAKGCEPQ